MGNQQFGGATLRIPFSGTINIPNPKFGQPLQIKPGTKRVKNLPSLPSLDMSLIRGLKDGRFKLNMNKMMPRCRRCRQSYRLRDEPLLPKPGVWKGPTFTDSDEASLTRREDPGFGSSDERSYEQKDDPDFGDSDERTYEQEGNPDFGDSEELSFERRDDPDSGELDERTFEQEGDPDFGDSDELSYERRDEPNFEDLSESRSGSMEDYSYERRRRSVTQNSNGLEYDVSDIASLARNGLIPTVPNLLPTNHLTINPSGGNARGIGKPFAAIYSGLPGK